MDPKLRHHKYRINPRYRYQSESRLLKYPFPQDPQGLVQSSVRIALHRTADNTTSPLPMVTTCRYLRANEQVYCEYREYVQYSTYFTRYIKLGISRTELDSTTDESPNKPDNDAGH